jgi:hypothetical protein
MSRNSARNYMLQSVILSGSLQEQSSIEFYLVGVREDVACEVAGYCEMGLRTFLVEKTESDEDAG